MLAIGRALMTNPRLLILDEATEGLAPLIRAEIWQCLTRLKAAGQSILVIDKNVEALTRIVDRHYLIERGKVVWTGSSPELAAAPGVQHLGVAFALAFGGQRNELVLEFERAQLEQLSLLGAGGRCFLALGSHVGSSL